MNEQEKPKPYQCLKAVLQNAPGLTDRDRELIRWGYNLAGEYCNRYVTEDWLWSILYPHLHRQKAARDIR